MRRILLSLSLLVMTAITAMAQYTVTITSDPIEGYVAGGTEFAVEEIASALGLPDGAALQALINEGDNVYIELADGPSNAYTGNHNEFWMNLDGVPQGYGDVGTSWFAGLSYDEAIEPNDDMPEGYPDVVSVYVGQMPGVFKKIYEPSVLKAKLILKNGDKEVSFDVTQNVNPAEKSNLAEPVLSYAGLEVVKEYETTLNFTMGKEYGDIPQTIDIAGAADALGVSEEDLAGGIAEVLLTRTYQTIVTEEGSYISGSEISDALAVVVDSNDGWMGRYDVYDESTDVTTVYPLNGSRGWGAGCTAYLHNPSIEDGVLTLITGQFPGTFTEAGEQADVIELYIANGAKAVKITCKINIEEPQRVPFEEMTKAGETTIEVTATVDNNYATKPFTIDMAAILEAIGVESVDDFYTWQAEGELGDNHTESSGGYYYNSDGYIQGWGADAAFFIARTSTSLEDGNFTVGQMAGAYFANITEPTTVSADMVFLGTDKYYVVKLVYTVKPEEQKGDDYEYTKVSDEGIVMQIVPSESDWEWGTRTALDMDYIESMLGTRDFIIMTDKAKDVKDEEGNVTGKELTYFDKTYSCDPKPGFWYGTTTYENKVHQVVVENAGWGTNSFGVCYANGQLTWFQYPGQRAVGDEFMAHLYLVNEENGKYIDYTLVVKFVEAVGAEAETVGQSEVAHVVTAEDVKEAVFTLELDTEKMYELLGLDADLIEGASVVAPKSSTMYYTGSLEETFFYSEAGYYVSDDSESMAIQATPKMEDGKLVVEVDIMDLTFDLDSDQSVPVRLGFEYDGKRYIYVINLVAPATPAIELVAERLPLIGGSGEGSEMAIEVLEVNELDEPLAATYTITNGTWGNNASHMSLFKYAPLTAEMMEGYNGVVVVFDGEVPASEGEATHGFIPVGFVCPAGWKSIKDTDKFVYTFTDEEKEKGIEDFSIFFNASGSLKDCTVTIKGVYLVNDVDADVEAIEAVGIKAAPAVASTPAGIYTISGAKVNALQRGLNIVKMANGSVQKIYVK